MLQQSANSIETSKNNSFELIIDYPVPNLFDVKVSNCKMFRPFFSSSRISNYFPIFESYFIVHKMNRWKEIIIASRKLD